MTFTDLSTNFQDIWMVNFTIMLKFLILIVFLGSCYYYYCNFKPKKNSPYFGVRLLRGLLYAISILILYISPLLVFTLFPQVSIDIYLQFMLAFYGLLFGVSGIIIGLNVIQYGASFVLDLIDDGSRTNSTNKAIKNIIGDSDRIL